METILHELTARTNIENLIYTIRGQQVMLDSDIALLFEVNTKRLNEQMKRNKTRFPNDFCFQLNSLEFKTLKSQNATSNIGRGGKQKMPFVYTEHGIIALAGVLKSEQASKMSVEIVRKFVQMRKFIIENGDILLSLARLQNRQLEFENETNQKFEFIIKHIDKLDLPKTALFYDGEWFDAYEYISKLMSRAKESIILIDPYCDNKVFTFLKHKQGDVKATLCVGEQSKIADQDLGIFEKQYGNISIIRQNNMHDRYLVTDSNECYSLGTSLNYAGKKLFCIIKIQESSVIDKIIELVKK